MSTRVFGTAVSPVLALAAIPHLARELLIAAAIVLTSQGAHAIDIERFETTGGIEVWLVEDHTVPLVATEIGFLGAGAAQDPAGKAGLANFLSSVLDEGAGKLGSEAFQERLQDEAVQLRFNAGRDSFFGDLRTLSTNTAAGFDLLRLALTEPRFDQEAVERMRAQIIAGIRRDERDPEHVAAQLWSRTAFPDHPYGRQVNGTEETVQAIGRNDLVAFHRRVLARDNLFVVTVGAIDRETLAPLVDAAFGALPEHANLVPVPDVEPLVGKTVRESLPVPQTAIRFGGPGLKRSDPDFIPAYVMNHILGGGAFSSWLYTEIREKRGLAYGVYSFLAPLDHSAVFGGGTATRSDQADEALDLILAQIEKMANEGPTEQDLRKAKDYLTGSYALRFDSSSGIARQLLGIRMENLGIDYVDRRNDLIEAVTLEDVRRAAKRILGAGRPTVALVGGGEA